MSWQAIKADPVMGEEIAAQLLGIANDPATWMLANFGATIVRVRSDDGELFYFSPRAVSICAAMIATQGGSGCAPPLSKHLPPSRSSRLVFGFKNRWESFQPVRRVHPRLRPRIVGGKA